MPKCTFILRTMAGSLAAMNCRNFYASTVGSRAAWEWRTLTKNKCVLYSELMFTIGQNPGLVNLSMS